MFFNSIKMMDFEFFSLPIVITFGGFAPCVMNLRIRMWLAFGCPVKMYIDNPSSCGMVLDFLNLVFVVLAIALSVTICPNNYQNMVSIGLSSVSGILLGVGLAEVRILCSFKTVRDKLKRQNYSYLMPLFYTLLVSQILIPAFMLPSIAFQEQAMMAQIESGAKTFTPKGSWIKLVYYLGNSIVLYICIAFFGQTLQHVSISQNLFQLAMSLIPSAVLITLDQMLLNKSHSLFNSKVLMILSIALMIVP
jgi:hypothetical protein